MIEFFEFKCNIKELEEFEKKIRTGNIMIVSIKGIDCRNLIVRIMQIRKVPTPAETV
jgi:hypothetical protein